MRVTSRTNLTNPINVMVENGRNMGFTFIKLSDFKISYKTKNYNSLNINK